MNSRLHVIFSSGGKVVEPRYIPRLRQQIAVVSTSLEQAVASRDFVDETILVDINLNDVRAVEMLRKIVLVQKPALLLFAVDPGDLLQRTQAEALGARVFCSRPVSADFVLAEIGKRQSGLSIPDKTISVAGEPPTTSENAPVMLAAKQLKSLFDACNQADSVDQEKLAFVAHHVSSSIQDAGLASWMNLVREYHSGTYQHCLLVAGAAASFGAIVGLNAKDIDRLTAAGLLHDVGKAQIPNQILDKPGPLTAAEFTVMKTHPEIGFTFLRGQGGISDPVILDAVLHHHEMLDGSGYPHGLSGAQIPSFTRIMTVCDIYGALVERRSYKPPFGKNEIMTILNSHANAGRIEGTFVRVIEVMLEGDSNLEQTISTIRH